MARGVNKVTLIGNLGNDPEIRYTQAGAAIATLSVATSESWKDKTTGELQEKTEWHRVKAFGRLAEICGEYLAKGRQVYIEGRLEYGSYEKDGVKHYTTDIVASEMQMLGGGGEGGQDRPQRAAAPQRGRSQAGGRPASQEGRSTRQAPAQQPAFDDGGFSDDDIPF